jgi:hypothetical protein
MKQNLPPEILKKAIEYAKTVTGIRRPISAHKPLIEAWEECYALCQDEIVKLKETLEYIKKARNKECQKQGCTCIYDAAHFALEKK